MFARGNAKKQPPLHSFSQDEPALEDALFQHIGDTRLAVVGAGTRTMYLFDGHGSRAVVHRLDVASLSEVPLLMRL
jgi:hypothetical protein